MRHKMIRFYLLGIVLNCMCANLTYSVNVRDGSGNVRIDESLYIGTNSTVCISGNVFFPESQQFINNGSLFFFNENDAEITLPTGNLGDGTFSFAGNGNYFLDISGEDVHLGSLLLETWGNVHLSGNLYIINELVLNSGLLVVDDNSSFNMINPSVDAIQFNNSVLGNSYIDGKLNRRIEEESIYYFPVGDENGFHPLYLSNVGSNDLISVKFDGGIPSEMDPAGSLVSQMGWEVQSEERLRNDFIVGVSMIKDQVKLSGSYGLVYSIGTSGSGAQTDWGVIETNDFYLESLSRKQPGLFALTQQEEIELPNFFLPGVSSIPQFRIPDRENYSGVQLRVYNRNGNTVFTSNDYREEFNTNEYPSGTYYYELILEENNTARTIYNFIEIRHGKN